MPRIVERKASGVGTHVWKKEEYHAKNAFVGSQCSGKVECERNGKSIVSRSLKMRVGVVDFANSRCSVSNVRMTKHR